MAASRNANQDRDVKERICVLGVVAAGQGVELGRILSHSRWQLRLAYSVAEAVEAIQSLPASVILCEQKLSDGTWLDLVEAMAQLSPRPQVIVLSANADTQLCRSPELRRIRRVCAAVESCGDL